MGVIHTNLPDINFLESVFVCFFPDGSVVSVDKIPGFFFHVEYLRILSKGNEFVGKMLSRVDFSYYIDNPSELVESLLSLFCKNHCAVYMNLTPNVVLPTVESLLFLPEEVSSEMDATFRLAKEKLSLLEFFDIAKYSFSASEFSSCIESEERDEPSNVNELYGILDELRGKSK